MPKNEITSAIKQICEEKNISYESVLETIEQALAAAYRKDFGQKNQNIKCEFEPETGKIRAFDVKTVVEDLPPEEIVETEPVESAKSESEKGVKESKKETKKLEIKKLETRDDKKADKVDDKKIADGADDVGMSPPSEGGGEGGGSDAAEGDAGEIVPEKPKFNPRTDLQIKDALLIKNDAKIGDEIITKLEIPDDFGRMAAQTAKQVIIQRLREAERSMLYQEYKTKEGKVLNGVIQRQEGRLVLVDLGNVTAVLPPDQQVIGENYNSGQRYRVYVIDVRESSKGPEIVVSRTHSEIVRQLFSIEVPEITSGTVEIKVIAREAGSRSKVAVFTNEDNIDPIGSCVGQRGTRIQTIINELGGEKIDIIEYNEDPAKFISNALSPAKVVGVELNEAEKSAKVKVRADQLSLAIGKEGQNVRLAAKLSGWRIDIVEATLPGGKSSDEDGEAGGDGSESEDKKIKKLETKKLKTRDEEVKKLEIEKLETKDVDEANSPDKVGDGEDVEKVNE